MAKRLLPVTTMSVEELLLRLADDEAEVPESEYFALSDLTHRQTDVLRRLWAAIPVERRRRVLQTLVAAQEEYLALNIDAVRAVALHDAGRAASGVPPSRPWTTIPQPELLGRLIHLAREDDDVEVRAAAAGALGAFVLAAELDEIEPALGLRAVDALENILINAGEPVVVQARRAGEHRLRRRGGRAPVHRGCLLLAARRAPAERTARHGPQRRRALAEDGARGVEQSLAGDARRGRPGGGRTRDQGRAARPAVLSWKTTSRSVRAAAMFALGHIGGRDASEALRAIAAGDDPDEAELAELALEEMLFYADGDAANCVVVRRRRRRRIRRR